MNRAKTYGSTGEYDRSVRDYGEAIRLKPTLEAVWNGRCWIHAIMGESEAALADCNEALRLERSAATLDSAWVDPSENGQMGPGHRRLQLGPATGPEAGRSADGRGLARLRTGDTTGGNADISAAKEIGLNIVEEFARYGVQ